MNTQRRNVLKSGSGATLLGILAAAGIINPGIALASGNRAAFEARSMADTLKAIGAVSPPDSRNIQISAPEIAENGAVVPVAIASTLPNVTTIAILVEKNPNPLAASFTLSEGTQSNIETYVKMGQSANVYALLQSDGKFFMATKEVKVTLGGCGA